MRWNVELEGRILEVEVESRDGELWASIAGGPPARLLDRGSCVVLEWGDVRREIWFESDPDDPEHLVVGAPARAPVRVRVQPVASGVAPRRRASEPKSCLVRSPMPGSVVDIRVKPGQVVAPGQVLLILEAMKMQNEIRAETAGVVETVSVSVRSTVAIGAPLMEIRPT